MTASDNPFNVQSLPGSKMTENSRNDADPASEISGASGVSWGWVGARVAVAKGGAFIHITFPAGKADGIAVRELYEASAQLLDHHYPRAVVDLSGVEFVSSGMMGMLVTVKKKIASVGGELHVVIPSPMVRQSFTLMRLDQIIPLHTALQEAAAVLKQ